MEKTIKRLVEELQRPAWKFWISPFHAAREIRKMGETAREATPHLVRLVRKDAARTNDNKVLDKTVVQGPFADALVAIGQSAIENLTENFDCDQEGIRYSVVEITARFGIAAVPKLISILRTGTSKAKANAAWTIASIGAPASDAIAALNVTLATALRPDAVVRVLDEGGKLREVEVRKEYTEEEIAFLKSLSSHEPLKPFQLREHDIIVACLAALIAIGSTASEARPTIEYTMKAGKDDIVIKCAAESTLRKIGS